MTTVTLVPDWLCGTWHRDYIRRASKNEENGQLVLGPPDSFVDVMYIQTPWAFVDVRRCSISRKGAMGFAGVTSVVQSSSSLPLVKWHACLDMDKEETRSTTTTRQFWNQALADAPPPTEDEGYFERLEENFYREHDPGNTLEEQWKRVHDGEKQFLAAYWENALVVVAGPHFGFATMQEKDTIFCAGNVENWIITMSSTDSALEQTQMKLPGKQDEWTVLPGSTLGVDTLRACFQ